MPSHFREVSRVREVREGNTITMVEGSAHIGGRWSDKEVKMIAFSNSVVNHNK